MNYYLIKEYLKKIITDEITFLNFKVMFWVLYVMACLVISTGSVALNVNLLSYLPWAKIPLTEDSLSFFKALTFGITSLSFIIVEMEFMYRGARVINKKFQKIAAGGRYEK